MKLLWVKEEIDFIDGWGNSVIHDYNRGDRRREPHNTMSPDRVHLQVGWSRVGEWGRRQGTEATVADSEAQNSAIPSDI